MSNYINKEQDRRLFNIDGHIKVINSEMGDVKKDIGTVKTDLATVKTDVCWLKRFFFIVATASIASLIGVLIGLLR
ncbi:hypothetical protein LCGC14_2362520 [marine sediment metagenome]|uniref:Uncharacterized protein n=1 Tax=marine sediment metagenome TaxID=412755 RepID=A0A0F9CTK9_9ZZZZ|nr:hypothetical protein [Candidatus Scalindua sp.]